MRISDWSSDVCSSDLKDAAHDIALRIARTAPRIEGMHVYGPAPAPLAMLRGRHRFRLLVHARRALDVQDVIRDWLGGLDWKPKVRGGRCRSVQLRVTLRSEERRVGKECVRTCGYRGSPYL